jgi:hypothetical protein
MFQAGWSLHWTGECGCHFGDSCLRGWVGGIGSHKKERCHTSYARWGLRLQGQRWPVCCRFGLRECFGIGVVAVVVAGGRAEKGRLGCGCWPAVVSICLRCRVPRPRGLGERVGAASIGAGLSRRVGRLLLACAAGEWVSWPFGQRSRLSLVVGQRLSWRLGQGWLALGGAVFGWFGRARSSTPTGRWRR